jgi:hypothetical protein
MNEELRNLNTEAQEAMDGSAATATDAAGYIHIKFQCGPIKESGINGTSIENVIDLLVKRLDGFNEGPLRCRENSLAITHLQEAQNWLERRTRDRVAKGVEGTNKAH